MYYFILSINTMLACIDIARIPKNRTSIERLFLKVVLLTLSNIYPASKLKHAQITLTSGEESPFPGGFAKGDGNGSPEMP
jgi:hypothetical protein